MIQKYYLCTLLSDVVFNASLATEGNMASLDYIPGSNFMGLVAHHIYAKHKDKAMDILHSGKVCFGNGLIFYDNRAFYAVPNCFLQDKLQSNVEKDPVYIDFNIDHITGLRDDKGHRLQLKQMRSGYISTDGQIISDIPKSFALKSAYNREERRTEEGKMFGLESISAGTKFLFSVLYQENDHIELVENSLIGERRLGKSKFAQYGKVRIDACNDIEIITTEKLSLGDFTIVYAASHLYFVDPLTGQQTFKPNADQLGVPGGEIIWNKTQIRTYSYSPWNSTRNAINMERHCIKMGSVFYVKGGNISNIDSSLIGEFINEGLGRVLYNPGFLLCRVDKKEESALTFRKIPKEKMISPVANLEEENTLSSPLVHFLKVRKQESENELTLAGLINKQLESCRNTGLITKVTSSQWGNIRAEATEYYYKNKSWSEFIHRLGLSNNERENTGLLTSGKMAEKLWDENNLRKIKEVFRNINHYEDKNKFKFVIKFCSEIAKEVIKKNNKKNTHDKAHA